jgi:hypothetical protein
MTCLTGGLTPCGAATGIPGRPATSSSPTCRARAALTKASPGTPWSTARPTAAAQPGTAHATTRPTRRPPTPLGSQAGSHRHPAQGGPEPTEAFDITAITSHPATAADTSPLAGSRSHRGSEHMSTPPPHAKVPFQRCATASHSHADERMLNDRRGVQYSLEKLSCSRSALLTGPENERLDLSEYSAEAATVTGAYQLLRYCRRSWDASG